MFRTWGQSRAPARTVFTVAAALLFALHVLIAGGAGFGGDRSGSFGVTCTTQAAKTSGATQDAPASPSSHHHSGACCLVHCSALAAPVAIIASVGTVPLVAQSFPPAFAYVIDARTASPELAPLSARAPPRLIV